MELEHHEAISIRVRPRRSVEDIALPPLARARMYDPAEKPRGLRRLRRKLAQAAEQAVHGWLRFPAKGVLTVRKSDGTLARIAFDAHQSAYLAFASRALRGGYEPMETMFLEAMLPRSRVFYDVGANWGYYALLAATHPGFEGKVYAFDVSRAMNADLARLADSLATGRIDVAGYGLSNRSGSVVASGGRAAHLTSVAGGPRPAGSGGAPVLVNRLDDIALPPPDLMKIDVEGHEREVFEGGRRTLREHRPLILFETSDGRAGRGARELLVSYGYTLHRLRRAADDEAALELCPLEEKERNDSHPAANIVAVPPEGRARWFA